MDEIGDAPYTPTGLLPHHVPDHGQLYPQLRPRVEDAQLDLPDFMDAKIDNEFLERIGNRIAKQIAKDAQENGCRRHPKAMHE